MLNAVLNRILEQLLSIHDTKEESIKEVFHYMKNFPRETDYNLYQYGNLLIADCDIRNLYKDYKSLQKVSDEKIRAIYMRQIRFVANWIKSNY